VPLNTIARTETAGLRLGVVRLEQGQDISFPSCTSVDAPNPGALAGAVGIAADGTVSTQSGFPMACLVWAVRPYRASQVGPTLPGRRG
jgi:hypothetical protein